MTGRTRFAVAASLAALLVPLAGWAAENPATPAAKAGHPDFRKATWGMSRAQVQATEASAPSAVVESEGQVILQYEPVKWSGQDARLFYIFSEGKLVRAGYLFQAEHSDPNEFIRDYQSVEPLLTAQYGKAAKEEALWNDPAFQDESIRYLEQDRAAPSQFFPSDRYVGLEIAFGHLRFFTHWDTGRTTVLHALTGEDSKITHQVEYLSAKPAR